MILTLIIPKYKQTFFQLATGTELVTYLKQKMENISV